MKYPIGIQSFEKIRQDGCVYVDKTALIHQLANTNSYYFLSRPRRFGKSLLVSTLEACFSGQRELFKGLEMEKLEKEWTKYPVLHLNYSVMKTQDRYIRFRFLTEVTKFGKVSVFSDLNNLIDLSMDRQFQALCGITEEEIHTYFEEPLHRMVENYGITYEEVAEGFIKYPVPYYQTVCHGQPQAVPHRSELLIEEEVN